LRAALVVVAACAAASTLASASPAAAASTCPTQTYLSYRGLAYAAKTIPASVRLDAGSRLGSGTIDEPTSADGCNRRRADVAVERVDGVDPRVVVLVAGRRRTAFVLGARCAGLRGTVYWNCLLRPLVFRSRPYTEMRYPGARTVPTAGSAGEGRLAGRAVPVARIRGVDPALALAVAGDRDAAYVAAGVCPYEAFGARAATDDLLRCLRSPVWFTFDPPGAEPGARVVARSDRPPGPDVSGAVVRLVRLPRLGDFVPRTRARGARIGTVAATMAFVLPDLAGGLYEAVVSCPRCAGSTDGESAFPAGSILVAPKPKTSAGIRAVSYGLGALVLASLAASIVVFRRTRRRRVSARESERS
jgi:hypothetical protein